MQAGRLAADNLALQDQLRQRDEQIAELQALGAGKRLEKLYTVKKIEVGDRSGGVSLDGKPGDSGVKVYVEPLDQYGSAIKAAGEATVELYDLAAPPGENLLAACRFPIEDVGKKWINGFLTQQYVFECPWSKAPAHNQITIRVAFVEYLTGLTFTDQKVVSVTLRPTAQPGPAAARIGASAPASAPQPSTVPTSSASGAIVVPAITPAPAPAPSTSPAPAPTTATAPMRPAAPPPATEPNPHPSGWSP